MMISPERQMVTESVQPCSDCEMVTKYGPIIFLQILVISLNLYNCGDQVWFLDTLTFTFSF